MNKILNTYLYSNISFMHSKVKYGFILQQYKNKKIIQTQPDFSTPNQSMSEHSIQNCLNKLVHEHTGNKSKASKSTHKQLAVKKPQSFYLAL